MCARSHGKALYIPGGKRRPGESDKAALVRADRGRAGGQAHPETLRLACEFSAQADGKPQGAGESALLHGEADGYSHRLGGDRRAALARQPSPGPDLPVSRLLFQWLAERNPDPLRLRTV